MINPRFPYAPQRVPFFYGWAILVSGTIGMIASAPGQTIGVSVFTDSLIEVLAISRVNLSLAYLFGTLGSSLILAAAGRLYDRLGARVLGSVVTLALGLTLMGLARVDHIARGLSDLLGLGAAPAAAAGSGAVPGSGAATGREIVAFATITVGFFAIRFFGQGVLTLCARSMVMKWFDAKRGMANAILGMGLALGFSYAPRLFNDLLMDRGWRGAWATIGRVLALAFTALFLLTWRDDPHALGMKPDGEPRAGRSHRKPTVKTHPDRDFTLAEARRTYAFWIYLLALALFSMYGTGLTFHIVSVFAQAGMDRITAVSIFLPATVISLVVNFAASWASDHMSLKPFLLVQISSVLLTTIAVFFLAPGLPYLMLIVGHGMTAGLMGVLSSVTWPRFYGTTHLGAITGAAMAWMVGGSAVGPYLFSLSLRYGGSYRAACLLGGAIAIALLALATRVKRPVAPAAE